jgi:hypothetical protein
LEFKIKKKGENKIKLEKNSIGPKAIKSTHLSFPLSCALSPT